MSVLHAADEAAALEQLHRLGCTDGLPVVIPTPARVERMVLAAVDDPTTSLGVMGPLGAATTIEKVADQRRDGGLRARPHADRRRHAAGAAAPRVRPVRGPEHDALDDPARRRQRPARRRRAASPAASARSARVTAPTPRSGAPCGCA